MTTDDPDELLAAAYALDGPASSRSLYARWAATYESGFIADSGYVYHDQVVAVFADRCLPSLAGDAAIVDIGCGTGLAGASLRRHTNLAIDGLDLSLEMLQEASRKRHDGAPVYRALHEADLTQRIDLASGAYDAVVSVGTFTHGHVGPASLGEVLRIVRSDGHAAIGINAAHFASAGFGPAFERLVSERRIVDLELIDVPIYAGAGTTDPDHFAHVAVFRVG